MASYLTPTTLPDALQALAAGKRTVLAGGTDHYPARATIARDEDILDLARLPDLRRIERTATGWRIGALVTWTYLLAAGLPPLFDGLREAARQIGGPQVQNRGTLAGNLCNASPAADGIPTLLALDAAVELASVASTRVLSLSDFVIGPRRTALRADEILLAIHVPDRPARSVFLKLGARRYLVISITTVAVTLELEAGVVRQARAAVGACGPVATRLPALEAALLGQPPDPALVRPEHLWPLAPIDDVRASAQYRLAATEELLRRALEALR